MSKLKTITIIALLGVLNSSHLNATSVTVKVGAGIRPPFLIDDEKGMGPEIISVLNLIQNEFKFELITFPISRRIQSLKEGWVDIVMWDNINWGWDGIELDVSSTLLHSKDTFISHASADKDQSFFDDLNGKKICAVNGYHYKFSDYQTEYQNLQKMFDITLVRTEQESIKMAIHQRCDISVASESAINWFLTLFPQYKDKITISKGYDTEYTRHFLVPSYSPISVKEINAILKKANDLGLLKPIYQKYGQRVMNDASW